MPETANVNHQMSVEEVKETEFDKVWISYGNEPDDGEWGVILFGKIYSVDTLIGAGLEDLFEDLVKGENIESPTGNYKIFKA